MTNNIKLKSRNTKHKLIPTHDHSEYTSYETELPRFVTKSLNDTFSLKKASVETSLNSETKRNTSVDQYTPAGANLFIQT